MKHLTYLLIAGLVLLQISCGSSEQIAEVSPQDVHTPTSMSETVSDTGAFMPAGKTIHDRQFHSTVLLPDGRLLLVGGRGKGAGGEWAIVHTTVELFNPETNEWTKTGDNVEGRRSPIVSLLPDGTVLVAGGTDVNLEPISSAEVWDPSTGVWTPAASLNELREQFAWVALQDGRAIIIGGLEPFKFQRLPSIEIYDPSIGEWHDGANMSIARTLHTATLLADSRVLVVGGGKLDGPHLDSAEVSPDPA